MADDDIDGCEADMAAEPTSDDDLAALLAPDGWDDATEAEREDAD